MQFISFLFNSKRIKISFLSKVEKGILNIRKI